ncbi:MAG: hypothetical protein H6712_09230 [Myxococcales bacterium]|nr:hypothetical protein [Myxococcales bacterium]MCB9714024.1 hypothetical protein [Myxococcales bacterium]
MEPLAGSRPLYARSSRGVVPVEKLRYPHDVRSIELTVSGDSAGRGGWHGGYVDVSHGQYET